MSDLPNEALDLSARKLTEETKGMYVAENIYEGEDDFFSSDASAAYEYNDGRCDAYPIGYRGPEQA